MTLEQTAQTLLDSSISTRYTRSSSGFLTYKHGGLFYHSHSLLVESLVLQYSFEPKFRDVLLKINS